MELQVLKTDYAGTRRHLFWLALKTSVITVVTLGFYRFWMKTRLRRFYWSAIRPGGVPLEYTGTGVEKLMGFLVAVVVLAFYIGIFNLILMFLSYSLLNNSFAAYALSFVGIIPIYFYAQYRARRYVLARTRWRGLRFGVEAAAWSYSWRAMLHWIATILTLGILLPRQVFWLEKFRTDRTWFGGARFEQQGSWKMLVRPALHLYIGIALSLIAIGRGFINESFLALLLISIPWLAVGFVSFRVQGFRKLTDQKVLGEKVGFKAQPRTGRIIGIYFLGNILVSVILSLVISVMFVAGAIFVSLVDPEFLNDFELDLLVSGFDDLQRYVLVLFGALLYFGFFVFWGVLTQVFVTIPTMRHYAETMSIVNSHHLTTVSQRPRDEFSEAEGFAEALDIGAAI